MLGRQSPVPKISLRSEEDRPKGFIAQVGFSGSEHLVSYNQDTPVPFSILLFLGVALK